MDSERLPSEVLKRYEEAVNHFFAYHCWLNNERNRNYLEISANQIEKLRHLDARRKGAEEILGLDRSFVEKIEAKAVENAEKVLVLGML